MQTIAKVFRDADFDAVFTARDVSNIVDGEIVKTRIKLNKLVKKGKIMKIKYDGVIYYMRSDWFVIFEIMKNEEFTLE